jgi:hypothetical protein
MTRTTSGLLASGYEGVIAMSKKTNFEQVPLEVVWKIVEQQLKQEETTGSSEGIKKKELKELKQLLLTNGGANEKGR